MALMTTTSLAAKGRSETALCEHAAVVEAISKGDGASAYAELKGHISRAYEARLRQDAESAAESDVLLPD